MADNTSPLPNPQSYEQILSDMLSAYATKLGIDDFNVGSVNTSFFEVVALATARASGDIFQILRDFSVDRATGDALKRLATEYGVTPITAQPTTGFVNVIDINFNKISTKIYAGANPPNIGSVAIKVSDASAFPASGSVYLGRGTPNVEGPLPYSSITPVGGYFVINLSSPTTKFHNLGESVVLSQGGVRNVGANSIVLSPGIGSSSDVQYSVTSSAVILDGEVEVDNVPVTALIPGSAGNIPIGSIKSFATPPFPGATVTNSLPFTTGTDSETDDQLRVRIKRQLASQGLGTATAVKSALIGATPSDEQATIVSDSLTINTDGSATVYVDNGEGYEAKSTGVGLESIVDSAIGGEVFFQLQTGGRQAPVAKAFLQSTLSAPFDLVGGDTLAITVGEVTYQHVFSTSDFRSPGGATAFEVTASINANTTLGFEAATAGGGLYVVLRSKTEGNDSIQVATPTLSGRDAAVQMGFPSDKIETLRLYKNDIPLSKDGSSASIFSQSQQLWSLTIQNGDTLILSVDGTAPITFTILDIDFIATGLYTSVSATNSLESWVEVLNNKLTGVTVSAVGNQLELVSNLGPNNRASLSIDPTSTLVTKGMFTLSLGLTAQGKASDFTLDRNTAQFELATPLVAGDKLSAGTQNTEANIKSTSIPSGNITFPTDGHVWILIDAQGRLIPTGVVGNSLLSVSKPSTNVVRFGSTTANAFSNVQVGDYVIVWSNEVDPNDRLEGRVNAVTSTTLDILVTAAEYAAAVTTPGVLFSNGFVVLRSENVPQKFRVQAGTKTLNQIALELQAQTEGLLFGVYQQEFLTVSTATLDTTGSLLVVTSDSSGSLMNFPNGASDGSKDSLIAFYDSGDRQGQLPLFIHSAFSADAYANPIDSYINSVSSATNLSGRDPNELLGMLQPYGSSDDSQPYGEFVQETTLSGTTIGIKNQPNIRRVRPVDRYFLANPLDFGYNDTMVVVLDNDSTDKSFEIPLHRRAVTNTSYVVNSSNFNAYDVDSGPTAQFSAAFGSFDFSNFKALMQAKKVLKPTPSQTALLYRATKWGRSGEKITVGYVYPSSANQPIASTVVVGQTTDIRIVLQSGSAIPTSIDASTQWNVTIAANTPSAGIDQVTYTYSGTGTAPALSLSGGEYVNISTQSGFSLANTGVFRVSTQAGYTPTATSFSVQRPTGVAVAESNKNTQVNGAIAFYSSSATTAAAVQSYVSSNLADYVSATIVNDGGNTGSGVIALSTYEDSGFTYSSVQLKDGINWILSSNLGGSPQFVFKAPLVLPSDVGYAFNNGEEVRLVPTTMEQVRRFISILAVSGFTTVGSVNLVDRGQRLELSTSLLGSLGSIQVVGGLANEYQVPVLDSALRLDNTYASVSADKVSSIGVASDQWFRLQAGLVQNKLTLLSSNSSVTVEPNTPSAGQATISLAGRTLTQRYFGKPRNHVRVRGSTFKVEKQGSLVCVSWDGVGSNPDFLKTSLNFNDAGGGTLNVYDVPGTNEAQYIILTGNANFTELSIGDLITISGMAVSSNNGTFLVTGVSDNGKTIQVLNTAARNEFSTGTFTLTSNLSPGDAFTIGSHTLIAGTDFSIGGTNLITAANLAGAISVLPQVTSSVSSNVVTVIGTFVGQTTAISYAGSPSVTVSGPNLVGASFVAGNFAASSAVSEGDTVVLSAPFSVLNQGKFRVIRTYGNSFWIENADVVEEEVTLPYNSISLGFDATTSFKVDASNNTAYLTWNGVGTEPHLENAYMGDIVTFGTDFAAANRGDFMVLRSGVKLNQIANITVPAGSAFTIGGVGKYFKINNANNVNQYYVWYNVNSSNSDPAPFGLTGVQVNILSGDTASQVAAKTALAINGSTVGLTASNLNGVVTTSTTGFAPTNDPVNVNVPAPFTVQVVQEGRRTFLEAINPSAVNDAAVFVSGGVLQDHRPQMQFSEYEASMVGDKFVVTGAVLNISNAGSYAIARVIDRDTAIVTGNMVAANNVSLNGNETSVFVQEASPYFGYKHVYCVAVEPGASNRNLILFDTNNQYQKINEASEVQIVSLGKLNFNTLVKEGLDSYRFNTGLIGEANRIIYGDPRDPVTYPGVGAAGADIFVREPLALRVQISVDIRLLTGAPFANVSQQVRSSVSSLINSNPVGQSIDISSIVSVVRAVPGVQSVAIDSPQYDATHDLIAIAPSQKAIIIDPTTDIAVNQIGN